MAIKYTCTYCNMEWDVYSSLYYYLSSLQESRKLVEDTLLGVKGVISFTFNMPQKRCILRVRTDMRPEVPCRALDATRELTVKHVIKNENGEEVCVIILYLAIPTLGWGVIHAGASVLWSITRSTSSR